MDPRGPCVVIRRHRGDLFYTVEYSPILFEKTDVIRPSVQPKP